MDLLLQRRDGLTPSEIELIDAVDDGREHNCIFSTNKLEVVHSDRDGTIKDIRNIRMIFEVSSGGCIILKGSLGCNFSQPYGGKMFVVGATYEPNKQFSQTGGVSYLVRFSNYPCPIDTIRYEMCRIKDSDEFVYNMAQFDEFMNIFEFYKQLSSELNNNISYRIKDSQNSRYSSYYFVPVSVKDILVNESNAICNLNDIVIGYKIEEYEYDRLTNELQDEVLQLFDIHITGDDKTIKKIRSFSDNLYLSDEEDINGKDAKSLVAFDLINISKKDDELILSGKAKDRSKKKYLNLYDMGQKVKLESIDNSLRLINQGSDGAAAELLQYVIGSKEMPSDTNYKHNKNKEKYIQGLDPSQKQAFMMATDGNPISLIKGPPGTGKTYVINAIVQYITKELGEKVVISSQTHIAIDNVLDELMENYDLIIPNRITNRTNKYSGESIDYTLYKTWAKKFDSHNARSTNKHLAELIANDMNKFSGEKKFSYSYNVEPSDYAVIGATTTTSAIGGRKGLEVLKGYDWLIIDEVSKCPITEVLRYLPYVKRIIMVGDDFQLAPLLEFTKEEVKSLPSYNEEKFEKLKTIYEQSVFANTLAKAKEVGRVVQLNVNYRSVKDVLNAYNIFYDGSLKNEREKVKPEKVHFTNMNYPELTKILNNHDVFFVEVKNGKEVKDAGATSRYNIEELSATADILQDLMKTTENPERVSVSAIFPYAAQIEKFQKKYKALINSASKLFKSFEIDTVDAFQGKETDIVLVNTVVTDPTQKNFLNDFRRINVSMSRARDKLFIFGNSITLSKIEMQVTGGERRRYFANIIDDVRRFGHLIEFEGEIKYEASSKPTFKVN